MIRLRKTILGGGAGGGGAGKPAFWLPLNDLGAGAVNTTPAISGSSTATFTRATTATTILSTGLIGSVASGTARSCYSPAGVYLGYLAEEQRTNLCLQSADLGTTWSVAGGAATISINGTASPDGTVTADKIQEDSTTASHFVGQSFTKAASALAYTASVYVKQAERTWAEVSLDDGTISNGITIWVNLATGALGTLSKSFYTTILPSGSATVTPAANGFYRVTLTATSTAGTTLRFIVSVTTGDTTTSYAGTTGSGIYAWGAQLEQAAFATSYIPTTTAAVTRNSDVLTYPTSGNFDNTVGTAYAEAATQAPASATAHAVLQGAGTEGAAMYFGNATGAAMYLYDLTAERKLIAVAQPMAATAKCATYWTGAACAGAVNGSAVTTGTFDGSLNIGAALGCGNNTTGTASLNGTVKNVRIWTRALADSQLVSLTS